MENYLSLKILQTLSAAETILIMSMSSIKNILNNFEAIIHLSSRLKKSSDLLMLPWMVQCSFIFFVIGNGYETLRLKLENLRLSSCLQ